MTAEEIMTDDVRVVDENATVGQAIELLAEISIRHLPVVRDGEVVGMVSDRDLRSIGVGLVQDMEGYDRLKARLGAPITSLMSGNVLSVDRATDVREIIDLMLEEKIGAVPVVDEDSEDSRRHRDLRGRPARRARQPRLTLYTQVRGPRLPPASRRARVPPVAPGSPGRRDPRGCRRTSGASRPSRRASSAAPRAGAWRGPRC